MKDKSKILKIIVFVLILTFYGSLLVYKIKAPAADDLPRQITIGREVLSGNFDILYKNIFSYVEPDYIFYNHHWLSGVIFYLLHSAVGWHGLSIFKLIIFLVTFTLIFKLAIRRANFWLVAFMSLPTILLLHERSGLRPEVFSYLFIALFLWLLFDLEKNPQSKKIYWLIPMQLFWVNMHVFFSIGIMLVGGFLLEKIILNWHNLKNNPLIKKLSIVFISVILVSFINPRGIEGVFYRYPSISLYISENQSLNEFVQSSATWLDWSLSLIKPLFVFSAIGLILFFWFRKNKKDTPIFLILAMLATATLSFIIIRGIAFFAIIFLLAIPYFLNDTWNKIKEKTERISFRTRKWLIRISTIVFFGLLFLLIYFANTGPLTNYVERGTGLASMSEGGVNFFKENKLKGPIFNDSDMGSYLIHHFYPTERVFVDNRFGDAYSPKFWDNLYLPILNDEDEWQKALKRYNFNVIFLYQYDVGEGFRQFMYNRLYDPEWAFVYGDAFSIILVRNVEENKEIIKKFHITPENAPQKLAFLLESKVEDDKVAAADIFNLLGRLDLSRNVFLDVVLKRPNNGKIWMIMGEWELSINEPVYTLLGAMYLDKAIEVGYKTAEAYSFLGVAYYRMGKFAEAKKVLNKALSINPERQDAIDLLEIINKDKGQ